MASALWTTPIVVLAGLATVLAACGGTTEPSGGGGAAGAAGNAGSAGTAGSGGTSGASGTGGVSGTGGAGGGDIAGAIQTVCADQASLPCAIPSCDQELTEAVGQAKGAGCELEFGALIQCLVANPLVCDSSNDSTPPPACQASLDALDKCGGTSSDCAGSSASDGSCNVSCTSPSPGWGANCVPAGEGLNCTCDAGPNAGTQFVVPGSCAMDDWLTAAEAACL